ncbi:hypothetical protein EV356DRAFT_506660 [Viridothelium virens]|uniref:Uncharacterized protein n=1 Tax=Viridothelium virens TaxID=1048519 RepID=A0A6A6H161_VIRVR|nr:hypothetical protein EV356DRAFT_506660 [Viridothelium virens]
MVNLADVDYPFEYERGMILKGFYTLLVVTSKWISTSESAFQWHFIHSKKPISLSDYTDAEEYHVWEEKEEPRPELETVQKATRTFLGWNEIYQFKSSVVNDTQPTVTTLGRAGTHFVFKSITPSIGFTAGKAPPTGTLGTTATFELQSDSRTYRRMPKFLDTIAESVKKSTILYAPEEKRGWLIPQLLILTYMAQVYGKDRSLDPRPPEAIENLEKKIWILRQNPERKFFYKIQSGKINEKVEETWGELLCKLAQTLEWAEEHARRQHRRILGRDRIYGFEFFELATVQKDYFIRKCSIERSNGGWVRLLDEEAVKSVVFCKGLGDVLNIGLGRCHHCSVIPKGLSCLAAVVSCLQDLKKYGRIPGGGFWKFQDKAFRACYECSSYGHRLQVMDNKLSSTISSERNGKGVVVFGKPSQKGYSTIA